MAIKKESKKSADAGWLLEVGVIGIDKTLLFVKRGRKTLLEIEQILRNYESPDGVDVKKRKSIGFWFKIAELDYSDEDVFFEWWEEFDDLMAKDHREKRNKGKKDGKERKWLLDNKMNLEAFNLIMDGSQLNQYAGFNYNRFNRIKAESLILGDAIRVMNGELRSMPRSYPDKITQYFYGQKNRDKVAQIIRESFAITEAKNACLLDQIKKHKIAIHELRKRLKWGSKKK